jgi:hypothetical protein
VDSESAGLEERLVRALDLSMVGVKVEVAEFYGDMHAEDYFDWEANVEYFFEWKQMSDERRCSL